MTKFAPRPSGGRAPADKSFRCHVHAGRRFVENEDRRIFQQCARYGQALFLPDASLCTALSELAVKSVRQAANEFRSVAASSAVEFSPSVASDFPTRRFSAVVPLKRKLS